MQRPQRVGCRSSSWRQRVVMVVRDLQDTTVTSQGTGSVSIVGSLGCGVCFSIVTSSAVNVEATAVCLYSTGLIHTTVSNGEHGAVTALSSVVSGAFSDQRGASSRVAISAAASLSLRLESSNATVVTGSAGGSAIAVAGCCRRRSLEQPRAVSWHGLRPYQHHCVESSRRVSGRHSSDGCERRVRRRPGRRRRRRARWRFDLHCVSHCVHVTFFVEDANRQRSPSNRAARSPSWGELAAARTASG